MSTWDNVYEITYRSMLAYFRSAKETEYYTEMAQQAEAEDVASILKHVEAGELELAQREMRMLRNSWAEDAADIAAIRAAEVAEEDRMVSGPMR